MTNQIPLHPLAAPPAFGFSLPGVIPETSLLGSLLEAGPAQADALMRAAVQALLQWQQRAGAVTPIPPHFDASRVSEQLQRFAQACVAQEFGRSWTETQQGWWAHCCQVLTANFETQPQICLHGDFSPARLLPGEPADADARASPSAVGPVSYDLVSLLRDPALAWQEEQELDWAIRYWEQARKAGLPLGDDFGSFWQQLEWTGLQRHLAQAGELCRLKAAGQVPPAVAAELLPRLFAYATKVSTRYVQLSPLTHLLQDLQGSLVQTGFTLR